MLCSSVKGHLKREILQKKGSNRFNKKNRMEHQSIDFRFGRISGISKIEDGTSIRDPPLQKQVRNAP